MSNHTPEPWSKNAISPTVYDSEGIAILRCEGRTLIAENEANASRIVACVNACVGVSDDALDGGWKAVEISAYAKSLEAQLAAVTAQRDELLAAVKSAKSWLEGWASADQEIEIIDMAIAKCEVQNG